MAAGAGSKAIIAAFPANLRIAIIEMRSLTTAELATELNEVERRAPAVVPIVRPMSIKPDIFAAAHSEETT